MTILTELKNCLILKESRGSRELKRIKIPLKGVEPLCVVEKRQVQVFDINNKNSKEEFLWT